MKVAIIGAGQVGATAGLLIAQQNIADVMLIDVVDGLAQGKAMDIAQAGALLGYDVNVRGSTGLDDMRGSDIVVMTAGLARKPGMSRFDLLFKNAEIVSSVLNVAMKVCPEAVMIMVTNPLDLIVRVALEATSKPREQLFGMGGLLDSSRFRYFMKQATRASYADIDGIVVGEHGDGMLPRYQAAMVSGRTLSETVGPARASELADQARNGGAEIVSHLKTGSAFYAPAASIMRMVRAVLNDTGEVISTCTLMKGEHGLTDVALSLPVVLGKGGIKVFAPFTPTQDELKAMEASKASQAGLLAQLKSI